MQDASWQRAVERGGNAGAPFVEAQDAGSLVERDAQQFGRLLHHLLLSLLQLAHVEDLILGLHGEM